MTPSCLHSLHVIPGLDPGIHLCAERRKQRGWPGHLAKLASRHPAMTWGKNNVQHAVPNSIARGIAIDLAGALEGEEEERKTKVKRRAAWLAYKFWLLRQKLKALNCDDCGFDPSADASLAGLPRRSLFDVHHKNPLAEGVRRTTTDDFALLCPRCHRIEHVRLRTFSVRGLGRPLGSEKPLLSHTVC
jgi:predicted HNH restriction endonuclease